MKHKKVTTYMERTKIVTQHYHLLQGLKQIPVGLLFLMTALDRTGWYPLYSIWQPISGFLTITLALVSIWLIGRYYDQKIGKVIQRFSAKHMLLAISFFAVILVSQWFEGSWQLPISASILSFAFIYVLGFWATGRIFYQYMATAFLLIIISLLPLTGLVSTFQLNLFGPSAHGVALVGVIIILAGLMDHWWLIRSLQSLQKGMQ